VESSNELWRERVNAFLESGMRVGDYCRQHELSQDRFRYWRNRYSPDSVPRRKKTPARKTSFIQIKSAPIKQEVISTSVEIEIGGTILKVNGRPDPQWFASVLQNLTRAGHVLQ
jgi:transposase-like protein